MFRHQAAILSCERVTEDAHYCIVVLLQQYGLCWLTCVTENFNGLRFLIFVMKVRATSSWSACWRNDPLLLINCLRMAPWCRNM